jgi:hypothetical protein
VGLGEAQRPEYVGVEGERPVEIAADEVDVAESDQH